MKNNCDGIADIFAYNRTLTGGFGLGVWKGSYDLDNMIQFTLVKDILKYDAGFAFLSQLAPQPTDLPAVHDVDGDGDMDVLMFVFDFNFLNHVQYIRNTSVEDGYGCDSLIYTLEHQCFGLFEETGVYNICNLSPRIDSCANNTNWSMRLHQQTNTVIEVIA